MSQYPINNFPNPDDLHGPCDSEENKNNNNKKINFGGENQEYAGN